ncbi:MULTISPECIES: M15 family metallopeptidase [unclassified Calothrix]|uniref:M15 family metallopeptidase n=1 Tax=unclassified Calothrix TaxID=2619626 RepID=UPI001F54A31E|nr:MULTISPECIES: M15 family metallopeptidase [unclassified Calothrix]
MKFFNRLWTRLRFVVPIILITVGIILNGHAAIRFLSQNLLTPSPSSTPTISPLQKITPSVIPSVIKAPTTSTKTALSDKTKFGHFPYSEANPKEMMIVASYALSEYQRLEKLSPEAALALMKLIYAARDEGVWIIPVSGFRTVAAQEKLFQKQIEKRGSPEAAAKLSAPPGYSEHHTGYAVDLADGNFPKQDITNQFAETKAFQWLTVHAKEFGFEMSFTKNNSQGVSYEPWHWRYIGSSHAAAIFANAKSSRF